jgi:hypothetical protein
MSPLTPGPPTAARKTAAGASLSDLHRLHRIESVPFACRAQSSVHNTAPGLSSQTKRTQRPDQSGPTYANSPQAVALILRRFLPGRQSDRRAPRCLLTTLSPSPFRPLVAVAAAVTRYLRFVFAIFAAFCRRFLFAAVAIVLV